MDASTSPYLTDNFAPVRSEDDFELKVVGEIPVDLAGALYRDGPNPQFDPRDHYHWFGGDGMIHAFFVAGGKVRYRNRYVRTPKWRAEHAAGRALFGTFGNPATTDPSVRDQDSGTANTNVVWHAGRLLALEEAHKPFELDPLSLESRGYVDQFRGPVTAHPKIDPKTREMVWFAYSSGEVDFNSTASYGVTDGSGKVIRRDDFEAPYCSMIHDFQMTAGHVLFPVLPLTGSLQRAMAGGPAYAWEPDKGAFVGVLARGAGVDTIRWFNTEACYVFHSMNAWEEGDRIFADVMEYPAAPLFPNADGRPTRDSDWDARLVRWTLDLTDNSNQIKRQPLDDLAGEFPRFDERRAGLSYRHGWFACRSHGRRSATFFDTLAHVDHLTGKHVTYSLPKGDGLSEPVFVPRSANAPEGDGWLALVVYRRAEDRSDFLVFDAQNISAGPIGSAEVPRRVPFGFHGNWRPQSDI
jgi:carotenoid cleavage dioxygenase-like enzyme